MHVEKKRDIGIPQHPVQTVQEVELLTGGYDRVASLEYAHGGLGILRWVQDERVVTYGQCGRIGLPVENNGFDPGLIGQVYCLHALQGTSDYRQPHPTHTPPSWVCGHRG